MPRERRHESNDYFRHTARVIGRVVEGFLINLFRN